MFVTHAQYEALALSHRIAVMNQGAIEQLDEPSRIYGFPSNRFVADFIGNVNMLDATVAAAGAVGFALDAADARHGHRARARRRRAGHKGVFVIRPEQVTIRAPAEPTPDPNQFEGKVNDFLYVGDVTTYIVDLPRRAAIEALLPNSSPGRAKFFEIGDPVRVSWKAEAGAFLDA